MTIQDIEREVETFLDNKLDKRCSAQEFNEHASKLLNLMVSIYNKHDVRMTAQEAWDVLYSRVK